MQLHAVLGKSIVTIANAALWKNWTKITIYTSSKSMAEKVVVQITELANSSSIQKMIDPEIVVIPELSDTASIREMLDGLKQVLANRTKAESNHVLFYSATVPHLFQIVKILGIQSILVVESGKLRIKGLHNHSWDMLSLNVDQFLTLHGLERRKDTLDKWWICAGDELIFREDKLSKPIEIGSRGKIHFHWVTPPSSNQKKILSKTILNLQNHLGGHAMENHTNDKLMSLWMKNTSLPLEIGGEEE